MSDLALMRGISEEAGNPSTIVIRDRSSHTYEDIPSGIDSLSAGDELFVQLDMYATDRASAIKKLSATIGVIVYSVNSTTAPVVQAIAITGAGVLSLSGTAVPFATGASNFSPAVWYANRGGSNVSIGRLSDSVFVVFLKLQGRAEGYIRAGYVDGAGQVAMAGVGSESSGVYSPWIVGLDATRFEYFLDVSYLAKTRRGTVDPSTYDTSIESVALLGLWDLTGTQTSKVRATLIDTDRVIALGCGYTAAAPYWHLYACEVYDNAGTLTAGTLLAIDSALYLEDAASLGDIAILSSEDKTCLALYYADGFTQIAELTINADHTITLGTPVEVDTGLSGQMELAHIIDNYVAGIYRPSTGSSHTQNTLQVFIAEKYEALTIPEGFTVEGNGGDLINAAATLSLMGSLYPTALFVDTTSADGYLQTFPCTQGTGGITDTCVGLIRIRAQREDDFTIGSHKQSGGVDVEQLVEFLPGG